MKIFFILVVLLCGCVNKQNAKLERDLRTNLTETEIASLHTEITIDELSIRTNLRGFIDLNIPILVIDIKDQPKKQCIVFFDEKKRRILCVLKSDLDYGPENKAVIIWPRQFAGQIATESNLQFIDQQRELSSK